MSTPWWHKLLVDIQPQLQNDDERAWVSELLNPASRWLVLAYLGPSSTICFVVGNIQDSRSHWSRWYAATWPTAIATVFVVAKSHANRTIEQTVDEAESVATLRIAPSRFQPVSETNKYASPAERVGWQVLSKWQAGEYKALADVHINKDELQRGYARIHEWYKATHATWFSCYRAMALFTQLRTNAASPILLRCVDAEMLASVCAHVTRRNTAYWTKHYIDVCCVASTQPMLKQLVMLEDMRRWIAKGVALRSFAKEQKRAGTVPGHEGDAWKQRQLLAHHFAAHEALYYRLFDAWTHSMKKETLEYLHRDRVMEWQSVVREGESVVHEHVPGRMRGETTPTSVPILWTIDTLSAHLKVSRFRFGAVMHLVTKAYNGGAMRLEVPWCARALETNAKNQNDPRHFVSQKEWDSNTKGVTAAWLSPTVACKKTQQAPDWSAVETILRFYEDKDAPVFDELVSQLKGEDGKWETLCRAAAKEANDEEELNNNETPMQREARRIHVSSFYSDTWEEVQHVYKQLARCKRQNEHTLKGPVPTFASEGHATPLMP